MYTNLISEDYLMHHGVKGMKWGVRHDKPSIGKRYSNWSRNTANKRYNKESEKIEKRRQKRSDENFLRNTKYGQKVDKISNKNYDKAQRKIEERRARSMQEHDEFDRAIDKISKTKKSANNFLDSKLGKVSSKQKYSKPSDFFKQAGSNFVQNLKQGTNFYEKSYNSIVNGKPKEVGKHYVDWLNQDIKVIGLTGSKTMKRKRYMTGLYNPIY